MRTDASRATVASASLPAGAPTRADGVPVLVRGLERRFSRHVALTDVDLTVGQGEVRAILGPNGAGKTTLLRILTGLVEPSAGTVLLLGEPITALRQRRARGRIGLVPSGDRTLYLRLSAVENLVFFGRLHGLRGDSARRRAMECLEAVRLADVAHRRVGLFSHGMQKRISLARAIMTPASVLFVDEATHDLDPVAAADIRDLVRTTAICNGTAVLWATQRLEEIRDFAESVTLLDHGRVRFDGTVPELMARSTANRHIIRVVSAGYDLETLAGLLGDHVTFADVLGSDHLHVTLAHGMRIGQVVSALEELGIGVISCSGQRNELEDAFLAMVSERAEC